MDFANAAKAFIVKDGKLLMVKKQSTDPHEPGDWDIPGGRLEPGESPFEGVKREIKEETNLEIEIIRPLGIHYFMRDDGQQITMMIFLCKPLTDEIILSEEHTDYKWEEITKDKLKETHYIPEVETYLEYFSKH